MEEIKHVFNVCRRKALSQERRRVSEDAQRRPRWSYVSSLLKAISKNIHDSLSCFFRGGLQSQENATTHHHPC